MAARCPIITAYLFHAGGHDDPAELKANEGKSFLGSYVLGMGFTFDDTDTKGVANPDRADARADRRKTHATPNASSRTSAARRSTIRPTHAHHRYVINFGEMTEEEARRWPDLMRIVEEKVKPRRLEHNREIASKVLVAICENTTRDAVRRHPRPGAGAGDLRVGSACRICISCPRAWCIQNSSIVFADDRYAALLLLFNPAPTRSGPASSRRR